MTSDSQLLNELAHKTNYLRELQPEESDAMKHVLLQMYCDLAALCKKHQLTLFMSGDNRQLCASNSREWTTFGIRVNCINPERTKTPMRVQNFGNEPEDTLLPAQDVAIASLNTFFSFAMGELIDVRRR